MNLVTLLRANAIKFPDKPCIIFQGRSWSNQEMLENVQQLAAGMRSLGLQKGERLALFGYNSTEWVIAYLAASVAGLIAVPITFRYKGEELIHVLNTAEVKAIAFDASLAAFLEEVKDQCSFLQHRICLNGESPDWAVPWQQVAAQNPVEVSFSEESGLTDGHSVCFTSGTTGVPKGVLLTQANLLIGQHFNCLGVFPFTSEDVFVITTPLCHRTGWGRLVQALGLGATACILPTPFDIKQLINIMTLYQATVVGMVPTMAKMLLQRSTETDLKALSSWKALLLTGERCPVELKKDFSRLLPQVGLYTFYASTETGMISCLLPEDQITKPASVGSLAPGLEVKLAFDGEILVRSGQPGHFAVMAGYFNDSIATREVIEDGWYHTGDIGEFDEEGILYIIDRKKDLIISGGLNVSPREVEDVLCRHPFVTEAAVVSTPDPMWGEAIRAFLVVNGPVTSEEIINFCGKYLAGYKKPKIVEFIEELPLNTNGKVMKHVLKKLSLSAAAS